MKRIVLDIKEGADEYLLSCFNRDEEGKLITSSLRVGKGEGVSAEFVEEGYVIDNFEEKLRKIRDAFTELSTHQFTEKVLESYVRGKGVSKTDYDKVMNAVNEFFRQLN